MNINGIVFDLEGAVGDTRPARLAAYRDALGALVGWNGGDDEIEPLVARPETEVFRELFPERWEEGVDAFNRAFEKHLADGVRPYPGVEEALRFLVSNRVDLAVIGAMADVNVRATLRHFDFGPYFMCIEGDATTHQQRILALHVAMASLGSSGSQLACLCALPDEVEAAQEAGIRALGAAWAPHIDFRALTDAFPEEVFFSVDRFIGWMGNNLGRR